MSEVRASAPERRFLVFSLGEVQFAVPLLQVKEVLASIETTPVPSAPAHFKGILNLRGEVISVVDLRMKFDMPKGENGPEAAIVILDLNRLSIGAVVDSIDSVISLTDSDIAETPVFEKTRSRKDISGVIRRENKLILLLDMEKTLSTDDLHELESQVDGQGGGQSDSQAA